MRNPILERKIIPVTHPTDNQKAVLAKIVAAPTPQLAAAEISDTPNLAAARDMLEKMGLITLDDEGAHVTEQGNEVMVNQNLATPDGQLTDDGQTAAHGEDAEDAPPPGDDLEMGFDDEMGDGIDFDFDEEGGDDVDFENDGGGEREDIGRDMESQKKVKEPFEGFSLLGQLRENVIEESLTKFIPNELLGKLDREEVQQLMRVLTDRDDIMHHHNLYKKLYDHFVSDMPYGVAKGRAGDPADWILNRLQSGIEGGRHSEDKFDR